MATGVPSRSKRPARGPMISAPQKAAMPPVMCTTPRRECERETCEGWGVGVQMRFGLG